MIVNLREGWFEALVCTAVLVLITAMITGSAGAGPHKVRAGLGSIVGNGTRCYKVKPATHFIGSTSPERKINISIIDFHCSLNQGC